MDGPFQFLFASSLVATTALSEISALHITVGSIHTNVWLLIDSYAGYGGGLMLVT
jgi:nitrogenase molybdenum-iron protein beta chain